MPRRATPYALPLLALVAGCTVVNGALERVPWIGGGASSRALAWGVPEPATARYVVGDTTRVDIDAGGERVAVTADVRAELSLTAAPSDTDGVVLSVELLDFEARGSNPDGTTTRLGPEALSGRLRFTLDARGRPTVLDAPRVAPEAERFFEAVGFVQELLPRLPGRAVAAGDVWTDTIRWEADAGGGRVRTTVVQSYTAVGDTLVDGRRHLVVRVSGREERRVEGTGEGPAFDQVVSGTTEGRFLWDGESGWVAEWRSRSMLEGTMDAEGVAFPLGVRVRSERVTRRVGAAP